MVIHLIIEAESSSYPVYQGFVTNQVELYLRQQWAWS